MDKIPCFLCAKPIFLTKTKQGFLSFYCHPCKFRGFLNSESAVEAIQAYVFNGEGLEPEPKKTPLEGEDAEHSAIITEIKKLGDEVKTLKAGRAVSPNPEKVQKAKSGGMAKWMRKDW